MMISSQEELKPEWDKHTYSGTIASIVKEFWDFNYTDLMKEGQLGTQTKP